MFELLLLRHAKSSWAEFRQDDADRPLNARGREAARLMGRTIAAQGMLPGRVLCSPAARTRETWEIARKQLPAQPPVVIVDALYDFGDGDAVLEAIKLHGGTFSRLLVVAHNPAIQNLALRLTGTGSAKLRRRTRREVSDRSSRDPRLRRERLVGPGPASGQVAENSSGPATSRHEARFSLFRQQLAPK